MMDAQTALRYGVVGEIAPKGQSVEVAKGIAKKMANASPVAVRATLRSLRIQQDEGLEAALRREADAQSQGYARSDFPEGLAATKERRKPDFGPYSRL
mmetsp:Transcript_17185/g.43702  ORF Transcript_17185/g.43702 Transcript_17185/m.43702 type:complete len:98 (+) Transcript_17185:586-879(+)